MPRPLDIRHDDILGRLDWIEEQLGRSGRTGAVDASRLADAYPVQMRAPGVFPDTGDPVPASETFAVVDSARAKREGELRHEHPIEPMEAPPTDRLLAEATARADENFQAERQIIEGKGRASNAAQTEAVRRAENDAVGNTVTGARTGELPADEVLDQEPAEDEKPKRAASTKTPDKDAKKE